MEIKEHCAFSAGLLVSFSIIVQNDGRIVVVAQQLLSTLLKKQCGQALVCEFLNLNLLNPTFSGRDTADMFANVPLRLVFEYPWVRPA